MSNKLDINKHQLTKPDDNSLFDRVVSILEQARSNIVQSVNTNMVVAYWLIGHEIVEEIQSGEKRAEYGKQVAENLSVQLLERYGKGFSTTNLWYFRQFYLAFEDRIKILHPAGGELQNSTTGSELVSSFSPLLSWSHYRALMRVQKVTARNFYEQEASECGWSKAQLERQIQTSYYERILSNHGEQGLLLEKRERLPGIEQERRLIEYRQREIE